MHEACLPKKTRVHGTLGIPLRAVKTNSKTLLLKRLFSKMNGLNAMAIGMLNIDRNFVQVVEALYCTCPINIVTEDGACDRSKVVHLLICIFLYL